MELMQSYLDEWVRRLLNRTALGLGSGAVSKDSTDVAGILENIIGSEIEAGEALDVMANW